MLGIFVRVRLVMSGSSNGLRPRLHIQDGPGSGATRPPEANRLGGNPSLLTRLWFVRRRTCVCTRACNHECDGGRDDSRCQQCAEAQQADQHGGG